MKLRFTIREKRNTTVEEVSPGRKKAAIVIGIIGALMLIAGIVFACIALIGDIYGKGYLFYGVLLGGGGLFVIGIGLAVGGITLGDI